MGDQEAGAALQQAEGGLLEPLLRGSIHTAGGLVQDEDRPGSPGPGPWPKLVLPLAEFPGRPRHEGLVPLGQALDETVGMGQFCRMDNLRLRGLRAGIAQIVQHRAAEKTVSWSTTEKHRLSPSRLYRPRGTPSSRISPAVGS